MTQISDNSANLTSIKGVQYYLPPLTAVLNARDGKVQIPYGGLQVPLLDEDFSSLNGEEPSYDAVGRGIYTALRFNPDMNYAVRYAELLQEGYPHLIAELASNLLMLDKKDVEISYLDRKINYLKIFALLEPHNHRFPLGIGATLLEKGLRLSALDQVTVILYKAEGYLKQAFHMNPDDVQTRHQLGEVNFLLGRYDEAKDHWCSIHSSLPADEQSIISRRLKRIDDGQLPMVPAVDYLQSISVAIEAFDMEDFEESSAILHDVMNDLAFFEEFPLAEICFLLAQCYVRQNIPRYAEQYLNQALLLRPDYEEARQSLSELTGQG